MFKKLCPTRKPIIRLGCAALLLFCNVGVALAHGNIHAGPDEKYELNIGFSTEPAYAGMPNGLELRVLLHEEEKPIEGLDQTLKAEIIYGASKKELPLRALLDEPGSYTTDIVPTAAGDYTWRIFGEIEGDAIDVSLTSSPDTFSPVRPLAFNAFPETAASTSSSDSQLPLYLGIVGTLFGVIGTLLGLRGGRKGA